MQFCLLLLIIGGITTSCIQDDDPCSIPESDTAGFHVRFNILTSGGFRAQKSNSRVLNDVSPTQVGTNAENYLDIPNLKFIVFDGNRRFLTVLYPTTTPEMDSKYSIYQVDALIKDPYFTSAPDNISLDFYILVLANYTNYDIANLNYSPGVKLEEMFGVNSPTFSIPTQGGWWYPHPSVDDLNNKPQFIPMSGLQNFTVNTSDLKKSDASSPYELTPTEDKYINMLRAMAKIEVVDRINAVGTGAATVQPDENSRAFIEKVELEGFYSRGTLLPALAQWSIGGGIETQYVTSANVPASATYRNPKAFMGDGWQYSNSVIDFGEDADATAMRTDGCKVFSCYVPEYVVPVAGTNTSTPTLSTNNAWIQVTVDDPNNASATEGSILYELRLTQYVDSKPGDLIPLLRNNIYRYEIKSVSSSIINLEWTVCPMDEAAVIIPPFN